jgi:hypothetical protein
MKPDEIKLVVAVLLLLAPGMSEEEVFTNSVITRCVPLFYFCTLERRLFCSAE